jgi:hypothetical protein
MRQQTVFYKKTLFFQIKNVFFYRLPVRVAARCTGKELAELCWEAIPGKKNLKRNRVKLSLTSVKFERLNFSFRFEKRRPSVLVDKSDANSELESRCGRRFQLAAA